MKEDLIVPKESVQDHSRRNFLKTGTLITAGWFILPTWVKKVYPPIVQGYPAHNIPENKNMDPKWLAGLFHRGRPTTYLKSKNELRYIGMPAGGLHTGTLYLGGDGRLWLWEIFNDGREGIDSKTVQWSDGQQDRTIRNRDGANYVSPAIAANRRKLAQGFALHLKTVNASWTKSLQEEDWDEVSFEATYPQATIHYYSKEIPVKIVVRAGAFYIPLQTDDSSLPATSFQIEMTNTGDQPLEVSVAGWLENGVGKDTAVKPGSGTRRNEKIQGDTFQAIYATGVLSDPNARDGGSMCLACMDRDATVQTAATIFPVTADLFSRELSETTERDTTENLIGSIALKTKTLPPGRHMTADYVISWHFNHSLPGLQDKMPESRRNYYYGTRFPNAIEVQRYIAKHFKRLGRLTRLWQATYYDSTLPWWLLERSVINVGTVATANTYRFASGRFWGWEGVNACEGTCTHVWQYGHALARLFPDLERDTRERVDLGLAMLESGGIRFRGEFTDVPAIDGQAGTILRIYREHQMSADNGFLKRNWVNIKKAVMFLLQQDKNQDGMTDTPMENTLDAVWEGEIAWIVGLSIAAAKAAACMAKEVGDVDFEKVCRSYVEKGCQNMASQLFNGEYFIHRPNSVSGRQKLGAYNTCHIDQVYGQSWAFQVGLGRLWDQAKTRSALEALWKYNFAPDVGPYIQTHRGGRPYALEGEAGLIMNTNPHNEANPYGNNVTWQLGYFHECMSGFEHQVAAHMMAEEMVDKALVLTRSIHDRYHGAKRNPYNEIECSDHYARAMASYGTFLNACGYEYHGPQGYLGFAPKIHPENFKAAFTSAEGWGSYAQKTGANDGKLLTAKIQLQFGKLQLQQIGLCLPGSTHAKVSAKSVRLKLNNKQVNCSFQQKDHGVRIMFQQNCFLAENDVLDIQIS